MAYLISRFPAISHTFILREIQQLRDAGFNIHVASINLPDSAIVNMPKDERDETARTYYLKQHGVIGALVAHIFGLCHPLNYLQGLGYAIRLGGWNLKKMAFGLFYFTEALMLARWMRANQLNHLHVHFATAAANVGLVLKHIFPISLSLTVHGPDEFYDTAAQYLPQKIESADFIVCISHFARSQMMMLSSAQHWHKFEICPLGVDSARYSPMQKEASFDQPFNILCVGRLTPAKGQRILIDACSALRAAGRNFKLIIVGAGPDETALRAAVTHSGLDAYTEFTGALNQVEVRSRYAEANVFALPSFAEGVPVVLMEAMATGLPCISTRITGIPELIRDGEDGLLITPSDRDELTFALIRLMDDPSLRKRLACSGRLRVQEHYDLSRNVKRLEKIYQQRIEVLPC